MRNTVHLVTAADFVTFRPLLQPVPDRALAGNFSRRLAGVDLGPDVLTPPRFLPRYDKLLLSFADRRPGHPARPAGAAAPRQRRLRRHRAGGRRLGGRVGHHPGPGEAVLEVRPFTRLDPGQLGAVTAESRRLPSFRRPHRRRGARDPHHQPGSGVTETEL